MSTDVITNANAKSRTKVRMMVQIGMLAAISVVLMQFEVPLPFAPAFYKIDFSEVPVLVGCFAMGPFAGAVIELIKIILHVAISGTTTAGVGDVANFLIGCAFIIPAGLIYKKKKTRNPNSSAEKTTSSMRMRRLRRLPNCVPRIQVRISSSVRT